MPGGVCQVALAKSWDMSRDAARLSPKHPAHTNHEHGYDVAVFEGIRAEYVFQTGPIRLRRRTDDAKIRLALGR